MNKKSEKMDSSRRIKPTVLMYVGPTVVGGLIQNAVYEGTPAIVEKIKETCPLVTNLFVPIAKYPDASEQIRKRAGAYYSAFRAVSAYKAENNA